MKVGKGIAFEKLKIPGKSQIKITFTAKVNSIAIGTELKNEVIAYSDRLKGNEISKWEVSCWSEGVITLAKKNPSEVVYNIIMLMDHSWSEFVNRDKLKEAKDIFLDTIESELKGVKVNLAYIPFGTDIIETSHKEKEDVIVDANCFSEFKLTSFLDELGGLSLTAGTNYYSAFKTAHETLKDFLGSEDVSKCENIIVFMADGAPTLTNGIILGMNVQDVIIEFVKEYVYSFVSSAIDYIYSWSPTLHSINMAMLDGAMSLIESELLNYFWRIPAGIVDTVLSSWLEFAMSAEDKYQFRLLVTNLISIITDPALEWIFGMLPTDGWIETWDIFEDIPERVWEEILKQVDIAKGITPINGDDEITNIIQNNTKIYATLVASNETANATGYGVEKISTKEYYGEDLHYGHLTDDDLNNGKLKERFIDIVKDQDVPMDEETRRSESGIVKNIGNYDGIESISIGTTKILKTDLVFNKYIEKVGDEGKLDLKILAQDDYDLTLGVTVNYES